MQCGHQLLGFPSGQDGVDAAGCPGQLVFQHGVGARAGLAHAVLDVGERAHGELQARGQVGAVAVAQCHAPTHDVVAQPFQGAAIHTGIMAHQGARRYWSPRQPAGIRPTSPGPVSGSGTDPITADALYPRWANFVKSDDIVIAETGTCSMGLAFAQLPHGARFYNQTLWGAMGWATPASFGAAATRR